MSLYESDATESKKPSQCSIALFVPTVAALAVLHEKSGMATGAELTVVDVVLPPPPVPPGTVVVGEDVLVVDVVLAAFVVVVVVVLPGLCGWRGLGVTIT